MTLRKCFATFFGTLAFTATAAAIDSALRVRSG
jgi:hypothetical protein